MFNIYFRVKNKNPESFSLDSGFSSVIATDLPYQVLCTQSLLPLAIMTCCKNIVLLFLLRRWDLNPWSPGYEPSGDGQTPLLHDFYFRIAKIEMNSEFANTLVFIQKIICKFSCNYTLNYAPGTEFESVLSSVKVRRTSPFIRTRHKIKSPPFFFTEGFLCSNTTATYVFYVKPAGNALSITYSF